MAFHETLDPMAPAASAPATFHDLMAGLGYLLFQWSLLDRALDEEILRLRHASGDTVPRTNRARTVNERLAEWRALLSRGRRRSDQMEAVDRMVERIQDLQRLRNLIATGLVGASNDDPAPVIHCAHAGARTGGEDIPLGMADLMDIIGEMEICRTGLPLLRGDGDRIVG